MSRNNVCPQPIPTLSIGSPISKSWQIMPHCSGYPHKDGEHFVLVGTGHTRICFEIIYRKGSLNANADALSHCTASNDTLCAATLVMPQYSMYELCKAQEADAVTSKRLEACSIPKPRLKGPEWNRPPLQHCGHSSRLLRVYFAGTILLLVPILPTSLLHKSLCRNHDAPSAGHQGTEKSSIEYAKKHTGLAWPKMWIVTAKHARSANSQNCHLHSVHHWWTFQLDAHGKW